MATDSPKFEATAGVAHPGGSLSLKGRRRPKERAIRTLLAACGVLSIATTIGIVLTLSAETFRFFDEVSIVEFLTTTHWSPLIKDAQGAFSYGVLPLVTGTLMVVGISAAIGVPLGVGTAVYLSEYATPKVRARLKPVLEVLAGLPTVVLGYFALTFVTANVLRPLIPGIDFYNALSGGLVVGIMIVPVIASVSEDALSAVPRTLREGAYGLGATKMVVAVRVLLPAALSGVMAAVILGVSRAVGETMIVTIATGSNPQMCLNPLKSCQPLTGYIAQVLFGDPGRSGPTFTSIFAVGAVLFLMTLSLNMLSQRLVRRFRQVY